MKTLKRVLTVVAFCFVLACLFTPMQSEAAPKLSKKKLTISVGEKKTLTVKKNKKKIKWSSSAKKVASVNKKGLVTGKSVGNAVITAKIGKKSLKCNVTVKSLLSANKSVVRMRMGEKATVKITFPKINSYQVTWNVGDKDIVQPKWANKWTKKDINLYLTAGNKIGTTTVTVTNKFNKEKVKITVIVEPAVKIKVVNQKNATIADYGYRDNVEQIYKVTDVTYDLTYYSHSKEYTGEIYIDGEKLYDEEGLYANNGMHIYWKLYKNGYVVDSGSRLTSSISVGERFADEHIYCFNLTDGDYTFEILYEIKVDGYERLKNFIKKYGVATEDGELAIAVSLDNAQYESSVGVYYNPTTNMMEFVYIQEGATSGGIESSMLVTMTWDGRLNSKINMTLYEDSIYPTAYGDYHGILDLETTFMAPEYSTDYKFDLDGQRSSWMDNDTAYDLGIACINVAMSSWRLAIFGETKIDMQEMGFVNFTLN